MTDTVQEMKFDKTMLDVGSADSLNNNGYNLLLQMLNGCIRAEGTQYSHHICEEFIRL